LEAQLKSILREESQATSAIENPQALKPATSLVRACWPKEGGRPESGNSKAKAINNQATVHLTTSKL